jgi:protein SCO1
MNKTYSLSFLLGVAALSACQRVTIAPPLEGAAMGGAFSLTNQDGQTVTDRQFSGKYRLIYFGYSYCPDVCPVDVQRLMQGLKAFEASDPARAAKVQPIFVSIDPERDTPATLKQFVGAFHPRLIGLTGSLAQISDVAKRYAVVFQKAEGGTKDAYLVDHSRTATLYGPAGAPIALISQDGSPELIAGELGKWVK